MSLEEEARFLRAGTRAGLIDPEKGTAALLLYSQLLERGAQLSFADLLLDRGLITRVGLEALERQQSGQSGAVRTISQLDEFELHCRCLLIPARTPNRCPSSPVAWWR
jgi:hypothetical protein